MFELLSETIPESGGKNLLIWGDFLIFWTTTLDLSSLFNWYSIYYQFKQIRMYFIKSIILNLLFELFLSENFEKFNEWVLFRWLFLLIDFPDTLVALHEGWIVLANICFKFCIEKFLVLESECCLWCLTNLELVDPVSCLSTVNERLPSWGVSALTLNLEISWSLIVRFLLFWACWILFVRSSIANCFSLWIFDISSLYLFCNWIILDSVSFL